MLQKEYGRDFKYSLFNQELKVNCRARYIPFEARMDQETFELFLLQTLPKDLVLIGKDASKVTQMKEFCKQNDLSVNIHQAPKFNPTFNFEGLPAGHQQFANSFRMQTNSAVKQVMIDDMLYKFLPLQCISGHK